MHCTVAMYMGKLDTCSQSQRQDSPLVKKSPGYFRHLIPLQDNGHFHLSSRRPCSVSDLGGGQLIPHDSPTLSESECLQNAVPTMERSHFRSR